MKREKVESRGVVLSKTEMRKMKMAESHEKNVNIMEFFQLSVANLTKAWYTIYREKFGFFCLLLDDNFYKENANDQ